MDSHNSWSSGPRQLPSVGPGHKPRDDLDPAASYLRRQHSTNTLSFRCKPRFTTTQSMFCLSAVTVLPCLLQPAATNSLAHTKQAMLHTQTRSAPALWWNCFSQCCPYWVTQPPSEWGATQHIDIVCCHRNSPVLRLPASLPVCYVFC